MPVAVAIIGAGPLGRRLARQAARAGFTVTLEDVMPANLRHAEEALRESLSPEAMPQVRFATTVEEAVREADVVIDCVPDELESKLEIFCLIDRMAPPRTVIMTPTRHLSITDLAACTYRADRCVAVAVDAQSLDGESAEARPLPICITTQTSEDTLALITEFWADMGMLPVVSLEREPETVSLRIAL